MNFQFDTTVTQGSEYEKWPDDLPKTKLQDIPGLDDWFCGLYGFWPQVCPVLPSGPSLISRCVLDACKRPQILNTNKFPYSLLWAVIRIVRILSRFSVLFTRFCKAFYGHVDGPSMVLWLIRKYLKHYYDYCIRATTLVWTCIQPSSLTLNN